MLISKNLNARINEEIGRELFASNQYIALAAYCDSIAMKLLAGMFTKQAAEERDHAMKFVKYLMDVGGEVALPAIDAPRSAFTSVEQVVQTALDWELKITACINDLMTVAVEEKDYAAQDFLRWFVTEQVEEVSTMDNMLKVVRASGERNLLMVEAYLVHSK
ncbi:MAG TPA: ferritin [Armatimonadota bacterium]|jgi:ferritin